MKPRVEILAPAGSMESMIAAINAGADAVYMGGSRFGARAYADNPEEDGFLQAIDYAHLHGCRLYMTVNTLVKEAELEQLFEFLKPYYERGLDAAIVQDMGVFAFIRERFPELPIHASTQMTVTGPHFAKLLKELGASRVVTARELSLKELAQIHEETDIEIESFVHGALCYCYSGQCLLSSLIGGRSGNRGRCAQPCRLPYEVYKDGKRLEYGRQPDRRNLPEQQKKYRQTKQNRKVHPASRNDNYVLSLKDLCTLDILPDIIETGVYSLKIEGRMKSPRYTAGVVSIYRKYVDLYLREGRKGYRVDPADRALLLDLFDRGGLTEGYYRQHNGRDMVVLKEKPSFRETNQALFDRLDQEYVNGRRQEPVKGTLIVREGEPVCLNVSADYLCSREPGQYAKAPAASAVGAVVQTAQSQPMTEEKLLRQIRKTGNSPFYFETLDVVLEGNCFLPVQALNELRRQALERLEQEILAPWRREAAEMNTGAESGTETDACSPEDAGRDMHGESPEDAGQDVRGEGLADISLEMCAGSPADADRNMRSESLLNTNTGVRLHVALEEKDGLQTAAAHPEVDEIYVDACGYEAECWSDSVKLCHDSGKRCALVMPHIFRQEAEQYFTAHMTELENAGFDEIVIKSLDEAAFLREEGIWLPMVFDSGVYAMNHLAEAMLRKAGAARLTMPLELNSRELMELGCRGWEMIGYGYLPAMVSAQCIRNTVSGCTGKPELLFLKDRTGKLLPVKNHCRFCYNTIYNPSPLSLLGQEQLADRLAPSVLRLQFTTERPQQIRAVIDAYADHFRYGKDTAAPFTDFTRGHLKRGVE